VGGSASAAVQERCQRVVVSTRTVGSGGKLCSPSPPFRVIRVYHFAEWTSRLLNYASLSHWDDRN